MKLYAHPVPYSGGEVRPGVILLDDNGTLYCHMEIVLGHKDMQWTEIAEVTKAVAKALNAAGLAVEGVQHV